MDADVIVVGAGLAGLAATAELADAGRRVLLLDQEPEQSLGGQAFWSFGGLFLVDTPEQRRMGVRDSVELAWQDWQGSAAADAPRGHAAARAARCHAAARAPRAGRAGPGRLRPPRGRLAAPRRPGVRRVRRRRDAALAP